MSFSFHALGSREEVAAQLHAASLPDGNKIGEAARQLVLDALDAEADAPPGDYDTRYLVKAWGHSGGGLACSLNLTVEPVSVPRPAPDVPF